jgi:4-diphosphocytidyl-2-C-methyl-D-erythritol kinase
MERIRLQCPAKVNLYLRVLRRRPDGYHDLVTVMQPLALADELIVSTAAAPGLTLECDHPDLPRGEDNLVWRAALRFAQETEWQPAVHLTLRKRIPVAAGLGGGSSDAAAVLLALNALTGARLDDAALHRLAGHLGADVPFFLERRPAVGRGIGTQLSPLNLPPYWYVLLNPNLPVSTAWVYGQLDLASLAPGTMAQPESYDLLHPEQWVRNDLESVTLKHFPELAQWLQALGDLGAQARGMSGSGPTLFGLFPTFQAGQRAAQELRRIFPGWLGVTRGLTLEERDTAWENQTWTP